MAQIEKQWENNDNARNAIVNKYYTIAFTWHLADFLRSEIDGAEEFCIDLKSSLFDKAYGKARQKDMAPSKVVHLILSYTTTDGLKQILEKSEVSYAKSLGIRHNPEYFISLAKRAPPKQAKYLYALSCWAQCSGNQVHAHDIYEKSKKKLWRDQFNSSLDDHEVDIKTFQKIVKVYHAYPVKTYTHYMWDVSSRQNIARHRSVSRPRPRFPTMI